MGAPSCFGDASRRARDGFWTLKCRPRADLGAPRASQELHRASQELSKSGAGASQTRSKCFRDNSEDARNAVRVAKRSQKRSRIDF